VIIKEAEEKKKCLLCKIGPSLTIFKRKKNLHGQTHKIKNGKLRD
jgi:hypothetical protein